MLIHMTEGHPALSNTIVLQIPSAMFVRISPSVNNLLKTGIDRKLVLEGLILAGPKIAHHCQPPELT
jgi:hypothetical protein